jgi:hypothetical protein
LTEFCDADTDTYVTERRYNGLPGEQVGPALGDILFGVTAPQAKLPITMPLKENDQGFSLAQYPGIPCYDGEIPFPGDGGKGASTGHHKGEMNGKCTCTNPACDLEATYTEGQIVGYRWYHFRDMSIFVRTPSGLTENGRCFALRY